MAPQVSVRSGEVYGDWEVLEAKPVKSLCRCFCGLEKLVQNGLLRADRSRACRKCAMQKFNSKKKIVTLALPDEVYRRLFQMVDNALSRCTDPTNSGWDNYGGRGIQVHPLWLENKSEFITYLSTLSGHSDASLTLDRKDNDGDYEPGNLQFVTRSVSSINRRRFGHLLHHGDGGRFIKKG